MTTQCANSECGAPFRYFRNGKIFLIDFKANGATTSPIREMEYFWLCGDCSTKMRVTVDSGGNAILEHLAPAASLKQPTIVTLKAVARAMSL